jgi:hypothetical protein
MHFIQDEMRKRKVTLPVHAINRGPDKSKLMRIRSLVPRFEWQRVKVKHGLHDFESEYLKFPRASYLDILDALASIEEIAYPPEPEAKTKLPPAPGHKDYEKYYIQNLLAQKVREQQESE